MQHSWPARIDALLEAALAAPEPGERAALIDAARSLAEAHKLVAETARLELEAANTRRLAHIDARRFALTVLAPTLTSLAVVAALAIQIFQTNSNVALQRELNEASTLRETVKLAGSANANEAYSGAIMLTSLIRSSAYGQTARALALNVLAHMADPRSFRVLVDAIGEVTPADKLGDLARLQSSLGEALWNARRVVRGPGADSLERPLPILGISPQNLVTALEQEIGLVGDVLVRIIRTSDTHPHPSFDLKGSDLSWQDLSHINLSSADLTDVTLDSCNVFDADLSGIHSFDRSEWDGTPWWRAARLSPELKSYLQRKCPAPGDSGRALPD